MNDIVSFPNLISSIERQGAVTDHLISGHAIGNDGLLFSAIQLDCPDDKAAIESAKQLINDHDIELWQRDRRIAKFERKPEQLR
jgi:hypothetical protein